MNIDLLSNNVTPAEGEMGVRAYHCTYYRSRLLGLKASGYLEVTNKRVIFQAQGSSSAGQSIIQSEVPIADVSGISSYKGTFFSLGHLLGGLLVSAFAYILMPTILTLLGTVINMDYDTYVGMIWVLTLIFFAASFFLPYKSIWRCVLAAAATGSLMAMTTRSIFRSFLSFGNNIGWEMLVILILLIYTLFCIINYSRRPTFSLSIGSKGGSSTPINISGATGFGIFDIAAGKALTAEPAEQAEPMLKQLGAVVLDIQTLGDFGINKWKAN